MQARKYPFVTLRPPQRERQVGNSSARAAPFGLPSGAPVAGTCALRLNVFLTPGTARARAWTALQMRHGQAKDSAPRAATQHGRGARVLDAGALVFGRAGARSAALWRRAAENTPCRGVFFNTPWQTSPSRLKCARGPNHVSARVPSSSLAFRFASASSCGSEPWLRRWWVLSTR